MPRTAADLVQKYGKHSNADDAAKDGLFWRSGKWGATNKHGDEVDASGAFFDLAPGSKIHIHVYKDRDSDLVIGHVKNAKGKKMQFKNEAGCEKEMRAAGFSAKQIYFVKWTMFPRFNAPPKAAASAATPVPAAPSAADLQEQARMRYQSKQVKLRQDPNFNKYVLYYGDEPEHESELLEFSIALESGEIDLEGVTSTDDAQ